MYLASAGIGKITIVDHDSVELSNLHRQVLHGVDTIGMPKVESARQALLRINPSIEIYTHCIPLTAYTLTTVFTPSADFHAVLDCSDTPSTRYLLSDVTARLGIPLISGAAQRTDGQLVVYNRPPLVPGNSESASSGPTLGATPVTTATGPCMRCVFPSVSRTGAGAERCSDVGVLGPVVGMIGVLMAVETIKVLTGFGTNECESHIPSMLLYTALSPRPFKTIKLRPRQPACRGCSGVSPKLASQNESILSFLAGIESLEKDYAEFCGDLPGDAGLEDPVQTGMRSGEPGSRIKALTLRDALESASGDPITSITIIDTRPPTEFGICSIPESANVPLAQLLKAPENYLPQQSSRTFVVCRLGNDSQIAARALRAALQARTIDPDSTQIDQHESSTQVVDVIGGLRAWARDVDPSFPIY
ncbi:hypothetical protein BDV93DRAFT_529067 [Ceratobasidium sp. AG-I]|nr:hypothetical protein BDV93DRAFT_529067 [Ceratobasidium sp. AG-I]